MTQITINTNYYIVSVTDAFSTMYVGHRNELFELPDNAIQFSEEEAEDVQLLFEENYPECKVSIEQVTEEKTATQLAETIADTYNNRTAGWDYQHSGQSRNYESVEEMTSKLESTLFSGCDIIDAVNRYAPDVEYLNDVMTIDEWAEFVADPVAQRITKNGYQDVTFTITLKN